jgi:sugar phosphate isomerase/epimerase
LIFYAFPVWHQKPLRKEEFEAIYSSGFSYAEISIEYPWPFWKSESFYDQIEFIKSSGLKIGVHLPWRDILIISPYDEIREGAANYLKKLVQTLEKINAEYAVMHLTTREEINLKDETYLQNIETVLNQLISEYKMHGIELLFENPPAGILSNRYNFTSLINRLNARICFDAGHLISRFLKGNSSNLQNVINFTNDWLFNLFEYIKVVHIHGATKVNGEVIEHYLIDDYVDFFYNILEKFNQNKKDVIVTLEIFYKNLERKNADLTTLTNSLNLLKRKFIF